MIVLDTNVLLRVIIRDHSEQVRAALALLRGGGPFWIPREVIAEVGWVLRSRYKFRPDEINRVMLGVLAMARVTVENEPQVRNALSLHARGLDFTDALILAMAPAGAVVATFDAAFAERARSMGERVAHVDSLIEL